MNATAETVSRASKIAFAVFLGLYAAFQAAVLTTSNFYAYLNDFWLLRQLSERFNWTNPAALQDGFFGYLYPFVLKFVPQDASLPIAAVLSLVAACAIIWLTFDAASRIVGPAWGLVAVWLVAMQPEFFIYASVAGADMIAALLVVAALWLLVAKTGNEPNRVRVLFTAGLLIAVGGTARYHVLVLAAIPFFLGLLSAGSRWRNAAAPVAGALLGFLPQVLVNLSAGRSPFFTQQGFNIYRQAVGIDWQNTAAMDPASYGSVLAVARAYPQEFVSAYLGALENFIFPLLVLAVAVLLAHRTVWRNLMWSFLLGSLVYALMTSLAFSGRALIALMPLWAIAASVVFGFGAAWLSGARMSERTSIAVRGAPAVALTVGLLAWGTFPWAVEAETNAWNRGQAERLREVQDAALARIAPGLTSMRQVFTNDFDFYSTRIPGGAPIHNGGLVQISQAGTDMAKSLDTSSVQAFVCSADEAGIRAVVWNPGNGGAAADELKAVLYGSESAGRVATELSGGLVISRIEAAPIGCS